eukprot:CAMPEP_0198499414 /NCGR_PEP_ID=MMETSP1462-20131121/7595_1 /TAXON_ID=1333877 /ORGANISM="Brandtodinium nutriculum, Strain RCC3387" /LENGTH=465 /DNA_ID=CAMNT_0044228389 /DNA_START=46 /DNA_END=1443 /DNA_ORIENTATION=+
MSRFWRRPTDASQCPYEDVDVENQLPLMLAARARGDTKASTVLSVDSMLAPQNSIASTMACMEGPVGWADDDLRWTEPPAFPTLVTARAVVSNVTDMDTVLGTAHIKVAVWLQWNDPRLPDNSRRDVFPADLWSPHLTMSPTKGEIKATVKEFARDIHDNQPGDLYKLIEFEGYIYNDMDLRAFPFDSDAVEFTLSADVCQSKDGRQQNAAFKTDFRLLMQDSKFGPALTMAAKEPCGWEFVAMQLEYTKVTAAQDHCTFSIHLTRRTRYYFFKVLVPLVLTVFLNVAQVELPIGDLSASLSHSVTLFLSTVALLYVVQAELPKTDYRTVVDNIILHTMYVLGLSCLSAAFCARASKNGKEQLAWWVNETCVPSLTLLFMIALVAQICPLLIQRRKAKHALLDRARRCASSSVKREQNAGLANRIIDEGVRDHIAAIKAKPLDFGRPSWLPRPSSNLGMSKCQTI